MLNAQIERSKAAFGAATEKTHFVRIAATRTSKFCVMHEWPVWRSCGAAQADPVGPVLKRHKKQTPISVLLG